MHQTALPTAVVAISSVLLLYYRHTRALKRSRLPPGPPQWPIIGNLLDMPQEHPEVKYLEWGKQYQSDMIHVNVAGTCMVIVNSLEVLVDLFEKRGSIYSSRPRAVMVGEMMGWSFATSLMPYGEFWKAHRRLLSRELHPKSVEKFQPQQVKSANNLLRRLLDKPEKWADHLRHQIAAVVLDTAYGLEVLPEDDPHVKAADMAVVYAVEAMTPGKFLVDSLPFLKYIPDWFPGAGFKKTAKNGKELQHDMVTKPREAFEKNLAEGVARPSFSLSCYQKLDNSGDVNLQKTIIQNVAGIMYAGGVDTTISSLLSFVLAMIQFPEVQAKAQAELDAVLGKGQTPSFNDQASLPYLMAIVKETLRWEVVTPYAIPHVLTEEDTYKGYTFPPGTIFIPNSWAILHDEKVYPDPFSFKPERFITSDGKFDTSVQDPELAAFGYGRRICPGQHLAHASIWITAGVILATFDIRKKLDKNGVPIDPPGTFTSGLVRYPDPFECEFVPRSPEIKAAILAL